MVRHVQSLGPHVLVLDLHIPNGSGIEMIRRLRAEVPETEIVVLTMEPSPLFALRRASRGDGLSPRETEILRLVALGYTSAEIAAGLHLSRRTVETHRARVYSKLGLARRAELVQFALRRHLIGS